MRSRYIIIVVIFSWTNTIFAQQWREELSKYNDQPVKEIINNMEHYFDEVGATKANKYHHWMRWKENAISHQNQEGYLFNYSNKNIDLLSRMERQESLQPKSGQRHFHGQWSSVNPGNFQDPTNSAPAMGRVNCIAKPPSNSNIIYVGAATGGVWKTYNHGASWTPLWDGMVQMGVSDIVIDYNNENHILVLTGDGDSGALPCVGVYESFDAGATWRVLYSFPAKQKWYGHKMVQDIINPQKFYLAFSSGPSGFKLLRIMSTATYPAIVNAVGGVTGGFFDMDFAIGTDTFLYAAGKDGLFKNTNGGVFQILPASSNLPTSFATRTSVAIAPSNNEVIYYFYKKGGNNSEYSLHRSNNGGTSFIETVNENNPDSLNLSDAQPAYDFSLAVDPIATNKVYIGTVGHYRSDNSGVNWQFDNIGLHSDVHNIYFMDGNQYICTDGGLSYRPVGTTNYISINNGLLITQFYDIDVSGVRFVGGTQDNGTLFWELGDAIGIREISSDGLDCMFHPTNNNIVFGSTQGFKHKTSNFGYPIIDLFPSEWHDPMAFAVDNNNKVIAHAINELKISYNGGATWPGTTSIFGNSETVRSMSQCLNNPNVFYICKPDSLARSGNFNNPASTISWTYPNFNGINSGAYIRNILVHPDSCNVIFAVSSGYLDNQIFKSTDSGTTWFAYSQGITELPVHCIYYDYVNGNGFYIGTELGVYYRNTTMSEWIPFSTYLPRVIVYDMKVTSTAVYAGTYGRGMWKSQGYKACEANLTLTQVNDPTFGRPSGHQIHKVSNIITSDRIIQGSADTNVLYQADNYVDLKVGFHAKDYNSFVARAAGCLE